MTGWQPIETAHIDPFDAEHWYRGQQSVLVSSGGHVRIAWYSYTKTGKGRWRDYMGVITPTHWMPLPAAPETGE